MRREQFRKKRSCSIYPVCVSFLENHVFAWNLDNLCGNTFEKHWYKAGCLEKSQLTLLGGHRGVLGLVFKPVWCHSWLQIESQMSVFVSKQSLELSLTINLIMFAFNSTSSLPLPYPHSQPPCLVSCFEEIALSCANLRNASFMHVTVGKTYLAHSYLEL